MRWCTLKWVRPIYFSFSAKVQQVTPNEKNVAYVMDSGEVFTYGHNSVFSCGHGTYNPVLKSKLVEYFWNTNTTCKQVEVNTRSTIFLTRDGRLYTVGDNIYGQLGSGDRTNQTLPTLSFLAITVPTFQYRSRSLLTTFGTRTPHISRWKLIHGLLSS